MKRCIAFVLFAALCMGVRAQREPETFQPAGQAKIVSGREDGRFLSSLGAVHNRMKHVQPECAFREGMTADEMREWQEEVRGAMKRLMNFPPDAGVADARRISVTPRDGYVVEKWEIFPGEGVVFPFLVLLPDGCGQGEKLPAVLCIPGSGSTKEAIAGEEPVYPKLGTGGNRDKAAMALHYVKAGCIAVAVDNPAAGETCDLERYTGKGYDYEIVARYLLEMGWSYLGYTAWLDRQVLEWMKTRPDVDRERIIVSGFSLGTEPLMVLGVLDTTVYAFVYNDFLCRTKERMEVMTYPGANGNRPFPNSIRHLIPGFLCHFDFPDLVAALAPRRVICTEGGMDRDFAMIQKAFVAAGHPERFVYHHYQRFASPENRTYLERLPEGIDRDTFFRLANVDPPMHYFKKEWVLPWLKEILSIEKD